VIRRLTNWRVRRWIAKARRCLERGRPLRGLMFCDVALEFDPENREATWLVHELIDAAIEQARATVSASAAEADARLDLASLLADSQRFAEAAAEVRAALRLMPASDQRRTAGLYRLRGRISLGLGYYHRAVQELAAGLEPGFARVEAEYYLGLCHLALGDPVEGYACLERVIAKDPFVVRRRFEELRAEAQAGSADSR